MNEKSKPLFTNNRFGDSFIYQVNRDDFDQFGADYLFKQRFTHTLFNQNTLYLVVGSDSLLLPGYIERNGIPAGSTYIFIEPDSIYPQLSDKARQLNPRFKVIPPGKLKKRLDEIGTLGASHYIFKDQMEIFQSVAAINDHIGQYANLEAWLSDTMSSIYTSFCSTFNLTEHINNIINAAPDNPVSTESLKDLFLGKTVAILAGGPSLEESLPWLQQHRDSLLVIAASKISLRLHKLNIQPDILIHADAQAFGFDTAKGIYHFPDVLFVHTASSPPRLIGQWSGMAAVIDNRLPWPAEVNDYRSITADGNTVTNVAISLAAWLGTNRIILLGVDLCHSPDGFSHAPGSNERKKPPPIHLNLDKVTTYDGSIGYTTHDFFMAAKALDQQAKTCRKQGVHLFNPSPKAVKLEHIEHAPIETVPLVKMETPPLAQITETYPDFNPADYLERLSNELQKGRREIHKQQLQAEWAIGVLNQAKQQPEQLEKALQQAQQTMEKINKHPIAKTAIAMQWSRFAETHSIIEASEEGDERRMKSKEAYFHYFIEVSEVFDSLLQGAEERTMARREELKDSPDFDLLFKQWAADKQPGRAALWINHHKSTLENLAADNQQQLQAFVQLFNDSLIKESTRHLSIVSKLANLDNVIPRVTLLYKSADVAGFKYLLRILSNYPEEKAKPYILFTTGMLAELEGQSGEAIVNYQQILDIGEPRVLEPTLKRIAGICIEAEDLENALFAFESLAGLSSEY
ncbi:MAG: 6-hydroxymethylpterin diphosphokinase MptE-like protein, partial [Sedimenticola sp.]